MFFTGCSFVNFSFFIYFLACGDYALYGFKIKIVSLCLRVGMFHYAFANAPSIIGVINSSDYSVMPNY